MREPAIVPMLREKRRQIENVVRDYERLLERARGDLAHVNAVLRLCETPDYEPALTRAYSDTTRLAPKAELVAFSKQALTQDGPLTSADIARRIIRAKGMDESDPALRNMFAIRIGYVLAKQAKRGDVRVAGRRHHANVWAMA